MAGSKLENLNKVTIERFWSEKAKSSTTRWTNPDMLKFERDTLLSLMPDSPLEILDLGCGFGELSSSLIRDDRDFVTGVDFKRYFPSKYDDLPNAEFLNSNLQDFEAKKFFDLILLFGVVLYLEIDEELALYNKALKMLNPNGIFIVKNQCSLGEELIINEFSEKLNMDYSGRYPKLQDQQESLSRYFGTVHTSVYPDLFQEHEDTLHYMFVCRP